VTDENRVILTKLALDRCLSHLSHMHSIFYLAGPRDTGMDGVTVQNLFSLIESMRRELRLGQDNLNLPTGEEGDGDFDGDGFDDDGGYAHTGGNISPLHPVKN